LAGGSLFALFLIEGYKLFPLLLESVLTQQ